MRGGGGELRRSLTATCLLVAALAGCGGGDDSAPAARNAARPTPARTLGQLVEAARAGDVTRMRSLLVPGSTATSPELRQSLRTFSGNRARTLYRGGDWAVAWVRGGRGGAYAVPLRRVGGRWRVDLSRRVRIRILGPDPGAKSQPTSQVAVEMRARAPLAESGLWVDGVPLQVKGGGTPTRGTIYGAPAAPLDPGPHVAVAFARTARTGTAVVWTFTV